jgi:penicillin-binding protein 1C
VKPGAVLLVLLASAAAAAPALKPPAAVEVLDRRGRLLRTALPEDLFSAPVSLDAVSPWVVTATLAAEDRRFYEHPGVDLRAIARAAWQDARAGRVVSGGSTITQQLVRALRPRPRTLWGKAEEAWRALALERRASKREILEAYLNRPPYGRGTRGIEAAARAYFGVRARDLTLGQAALLAGLPQCPSRCDPVKDPGAAAARRRTVLGRLYAWGWIDAATRASALAEPDRVSDAARADLAPHFARRALSRPGAGPRRTTLDADLQQELEELVATHLKSLAPWHVTNAAVVALDNASGDALAWVGSADFLDDAHHGQVDGVVARRQPGSALKPFLYGLAFSRGLSPSDRIDDAPTFAKGGFSPRNYDETFHGPVTLRQALACSYNAPAVRLVERMGVPDFLAVLRSFGLDTLDRGADRYGAGLALGDGEVRLLDLAAAYAALARGGVWSPPRESLSDPRGPARRVLSREAAYLVTSVLSDNSARVEAFGHDSALALPFPFAAKTGTTKDYKDNWAVGYTPEWTVAVWAGNFDGSPMRRVSGVTGAAPLLREAALAMERRYGSRDFPVPDGIREADVDPASGDLAGPACPDSVREVFRRDRLPSRVCSASAAEAARPSGARAVTVAFPRPGDAFRLDPAAPRGSQAVPLRAEPDDADGAYEWSVDGRPLAERTPLAFWRPRAGAHEVRLAFTPRGGKTVTRSVRFRVLGEPLAAD